MRSSPKAFLVPNPALAVYPMRGSKMCTVLCARVGRTGELEVKEDYLLPFPPMATMCGPKVRGAFAVAATN